MVIDKNTALLLIDFQKGFLEEEYWGGNLNNREAVQNASKILEFWRVQNYPIIHVKHNSTHPLSLLHPSNQGNEFQNEVKPLDSEVIIEKNVNSAFLGTNLEKVLHKMNATKIVVTGLTTDHCVSTTIRMAGNLGYQVYLVEDATGTFNRVDHNGVRYNSKLIHDTAIASLHQEFAIVVKTRDIIQK